MLNEIRTHFSSLTVGMRPITKLQSPYNAYTYYDGFSYGVAFEYQGNNPISQRFANAQICTKVLSINNSTMTFLILRSFKASLYYEFATLCAQFVDPGRNGADRQALQNNPADWWNNWKELLGNSITDRYSYSVLAEMMALDYLIQAGKNVEWRAVQAGSHDIESNSESFEVKSTIKRYGSSVTISGQHQLKANNPLYLMFCRMEKSSAGISIDDMVNILVSHGYNSTKIEEELAALGYEKGCIERTHKYKKLEGKLYSVDDKFPKITDSSFVGNKLPSGILHITYTVDLETLSCTAW
jgi:hypothetical protein